VSWVFGFLLDLVAILCLYLLVIALKTIYQKVQKETQIFLNNNDQPTTLEVILNTKQIRNHVFTIVLLAIVLIVNFIITVIKGENQKLRIFNVSSYAHLVTWIM